MEVKEIVSFVCKKWAKVTTDNTVTAKPVHVDSQLTVKLTSAMFLYSLRKTELLYYWQFFLLEVLFSDRRVPNLLTNIHGWNIYQIAANDLLATSRIACGISPALISAWDSLITNELYYIAEKNTKNTNSCENVKTMRNQVCFSGQSVDRTNAEKISVMSLCGATHIFRKNLCAKKRDTDYYMPVSCANNTLVVTLWWGSASRMNCG